MARRSVHFTLPADLAQTLAEPGAQATAQDNGNEFGVAMLVGDREYEVGFNVFLFVPAFELAAAAKTMERQPLNLDHRLAVEDEVGFVRDVRMNDKVMRGIAVLNPQTAKYGTAKAYIANRRNAGKPPEVSVGFSFEVVEERQEENQLIMTVTKIQFDHLALVSRGACSPKDGCGIGLSARPNMEPPNPPAPAAGEQVSKPAGEQEGKPPEGTPPAPPPAPAPAPPAPAQAAAPAPCGCRELEQTVIAAKAELKTVTAERDQLKVALAEAPKRFALEVEAAALGVPVKPEEPLATLEANVTLAKAVLAKNGGQGSTRFTQPISGDAPAPAAAARALLAKAGVLPEA